MRREVRRLGQRLALFGSAVMSDFGPKCAPKRTSADHSEFMDSRASHLERKFVTLVDSSNLCSGESSWLMQVSEAGRSRR